MDGMVVNRADELLNKAREAAGFKGKVEASLREGLEQAIAGFAGAPITAQAHTAAMDMLLGDLKTRFAIERYLAEHPEIEEQEVEGPVLVTSIPRTGTTATVAMMALDPRFRFTRDWELRQPLPPPVLGEDATDPRAVAARARAANLDQSIHLYDPDGPEEDLIAIAGYDMRQLHARYPMPQSYIDWYVADDFHSLYEFHERVLKLLQWRYPPNRWLLKAPPHTLRFEAFVERYPGSTIVMTHREPAKIIASVASMYNTIFQSVCEPGQVSKEWIGQRCLDFWSRGMEMALRARDRLGEDRFADVYNRDLVADPVATFERLYDRLGMSIDDALRARLEDYHRRNAKGAHGEHRYTAEEFGLSEDKINERFEEYLERFGF